MTIDIVPPPTSFLVFDEAEIGLDPGGVAVEHQGDGARRGEDARLGIAHAELFPELDGVVPRLLGGGEQLHRDEFLVDLGDLGPVHLQHVEHRLAIGVEAGEGSHPRRRPGGHGIGVARHQRRDGRGPGATLVGVVGQALRHEQCAQVGVPEAELTVPA